MVPASHRPITGPIALLTSLPPCAKLPKMAVRICSHENSFACSGLSFRWLEAAVVASLGSLYAVPLVFGAKPTRGGRESLGAESFSCTSLLGALFELLLDLALSCSSDRDIRAKFSSFSSTAEVRRAENARRHETLIAISLQEQSCTKVSNF